MVRDQIEEHTRNVSTKIMRHQFANLKRVVETRTEDDWMNLPHMWDITGRNQKRARQDMRQTFYFTVDLALVNDSGSPFPTSVPDEGATPVSLSPTDGTLTNLGEITKEKSKIDLGDTVTVDTSDVPKRLPRLAQPEDHTNRGAGLRY
ncbi:hypothetical protein HOY82DRAFT_629090 [Tuber indicum]|nr:hypothetical protein HOY82DRAFT_629090 [Tuber indicum]